MLKLAAARLDGADGPDMTGMLSVTQNSSLSPMISPEALPLPSPSRRVPSARMTRRLGRLAAWAHVVAGEGGAVLAFDDQLPGQMKVRLRTGEVEVA
jgi:hypothetical protein